MNISTKTQLNLVIGYPLNHTQSPLLHNTVYQSHDIDAVLLAKSYPELPALIQAIKTLSVQLTAVTIPFKEQLLDHLDEMSEAVRAIKAANTIIQRDGKLYGYNTDVDGIAFALRKERLANKVVAVLGAGGAARALGYYLQQQQAKICWINRTIERAAQLARDFGGEVMTYEEFVQAGADVMINTTPIGMYPKVDESPLVDYPFQAGQVVFDMVYNPMMTKLLQSAQAAQANIISGVDMFIGQGLKQIELFSGKEINKASLVDELRDLLLHAQ